MSILVDKSSFLDSLIPGRTIYFNHPNFPAKPHYFVVINDAITFGIVVMPNSTSKIQWREIFIGKAKFDSGTLVYVSPQDSWGILTCDSAFDCNSAEFPESEDLYHAVKLSWTIHWDKGIMPPNVVDKLRKGVLLSKKIPIWVKELL